MGCDISYIFLLTGFQRFYAWIEKPFISIHEGGIYFKSQPSFGGVLNINKRKSRRPLDPKKPLHIVLRVKNHQSVFLHQDPIVNRIIEKRATQFAIKI